MVMAYVEPIGRVLLANLLLKSLDIVVRSFDRVHVVLRVIATVPDITSQMLTRAVLVVRMLLRRTSSRLRLEGKST